MTGPTPRAAHNRMTLAFAIIAVVATLISASVTTAVSERLFLADVQTRTEAALAVQSATLERLLDKFRLLPPLLARQPDVIDLIDAEAQSEGVAIAASIAAMSGAREVAFLTPSGELLASSLQGALKQKRSSNGPSFPPLVGRSEFPKAFAEAMQGRLGRELINRGGSQASDYVFAAAVRKDAHLVGVVAVRVSLASVEQAWALSKDAIAAINVNDQVVVTNRASWRGAYLFPPSSAAASSWNADSDRRSSRAAVVEKTSQLAGYRLAHIKHQKRSGVYLELSQKSTILDLRIVVFSDVANARGQAAKATITAVLISLLISGVIWAALDRRRAVLLKMKEDRRAALRLERRVKARTRDLSNANAKLAKEVQDREAAEAELRRTQADLVQAAKLATLGQMSAALSHEFNQPLAAIRSNADNAQLLMERGAAQKAMENIAHITRLVERMAEISRALKGFTRRAGAELKPVRLRQVIDEALMLLSSRVKQSAIDIHIETEDHDVVVMGGHVRLEQVAVNLISNALDAVAHSPAPQVVIRLRRERGKGVLEISDNGPGVSPSVRGQMYDPFFTTKEVGEGLGLGLSIAYKIVHDFNGSLDAEQSTSGGALFKVILPLANCADHGQSHNRRENNNG